MERGSKGGSCIVLLVALLSMVPALAAGFEIGVTGSGFAISIMDHELLARAQPDECFTGLGQNGPGIPPGGCPGDALPKTNEAYVWGLAQAGNMLWLGTAPNVHCLVLGGYLGMDSPMENSSWTCEFGQGWPSRTLGIPSSIGDWRPASIYTYDLAGHNLVKRTPPDPRLAGTLGIRSAGALGDVVFLGGPALVGGINLFAFNARSGEYLGSKNFAQYNNIRKWLVHGGRLYTAVGFGGNEFLSGGGHVLKWTGSLADPWSFEVVGNLDGSGAELASMGERLAVSTWPGAARAGVFISPVVPAGGLTAADAGGWKKVWSADRYEPDPVTAATYGGGALAFFDGWLYWGTMNVPLLSAVAHFQVYGNPESARQALDAVRATHRAIALFRGRYLDSARPEIQLLYGEKRLPAFDASRGRFVDTPTGMTPRYGASGFGNPFNNYTWTMQVAAGQLFVGTMDWRYLFDKMVADLLGGQMAPLFGVLDDLTQLFPVQLWQGYGADLWRFKNSYQPAVCESFDGIKNHLNYGIRTMIADERDADALLLGTANPMNLEEDGGWELLRLAKPRSSWLSPWRTR
ncbi:hypothetical protein DESUT3_35820 [Desulfuromonas versatilis]|uniref:Uncharacterized protein n=1 Tax=Desulfuromonas versatilis TaxID=2802975 RepID=A0ABN6E2D8_9BACT|nr:hypothetical protein [Desulfuromonas versatilis]BCR06513.1 hypothetical protein DESUT3_35820 [Desulfuromonas versatilis]